MSIFDLLLYLAAFGFLALGSSLIINTVSIYTSRVKIPPFIFSFFIVGVLTSIGEIAVAINALTLNRPEIFVGSLLGGTLVIFLIVIPLMTILTRGLHVHKHISDRRLLIMLAIIASPALAALDGMVTNVEAVVLLCLYLSLYFINRLPANTLHAASELLPKSSKSLHKNPVLHLVAGGGLVLLSSRFIVEQTLAFAEYYNISAFILSMTVIAIGAYLPEISLAIQAASGKNNRGEDIAIGNFLGSASFNVLMLAVFTLIYSGDIVTTKNFTIAFLCTLLAVISFYVFNRAKSLLTVKEAVVLVAIYVIFVFSQLATA